jgi:hypothetical protein
MTTAEIQRNFKYHEPSVEQAAVYQDLRNLGRSVALFIQESCPEGREKSLAFTKLEEAIMWANASIARSGLPTGTLGLTKPVNML